MKGEAQGKWVDEEALSSPAPGAETDPTLTEQSG
jgi:hypothetical protein